MPAGEYDAGRYIEAWTPAFLSLKWKYRMKHLEKVEAQ